MTNLIEIGQRVQRLERSLRWRNALLGVSAVVLLGAGAWKSFEFVEARQIVVHEAPTDRFTLVVGPWYTADGQGIGVAVVPNPGVAIPADKIAASPPRGGRVWVPMYNANNSYVEAIPVLDAGAAAAAAPGPALR